jgi:hypothetical protein
MRVKMDFQAKESKFIAHLSELLECGICSTVFSGQILMCSEGHSVCVDCYTQIMSLTKLCPFCNGPFPPSSSLRRNLAAESIIDQIARPCMYAQLGCQQKISLLSQDYHEPACRFNSPRQECTFMTNYEEESFRTCNWVGQDLTQHIMEVHGSSLTIPACPRHRNTLTLKLEEVGTRKIVSYYLYLNEVPLLIQLCRVTWAQCCLIVSKLSTSAATSKLTIANCNYVDEAFISGHGVDEREATFVFSMQTSLDLTVHVMLDSVK